MCITCILLLLLLFHKQVEYDRTGERLDPFTLKMTTAQVAKASDTVNNNIPFQDYVHPDDHTQPAYEMTPGFKPFTLFYLLIY